MRRRELIPLLVLLLAVAAVVAGVLRLLERDRSRLLQRLEAERLAQLEEAAGRFSDDLDDIGEDLRFAAGLLARDSAPGPHAQELRTLIEVVGQYKAIVVLHPPPAGEPFVVWDRRVTPAMKSPALFDALGAAAAEARLRAPGVITATPPIALGPAGEHRVFATGIAASPPPAPPASSAGVGGVVAVLVDVEPLLAPFQLVSRATDGRLLMLGAAGRPVMASDPVLGRYASVGAPALPHFASAVARMRAHLRGCHLLPEEEAEALELGADPALFCTLPIDVEHGRAWSAATVVSTRSIITPTRQAAARTLLGAAGVVGFLGLFAGYVVLASRRAAALRETQAAAARLSVLHERTQTILDHIPTGVLVFDETLRLTAVNPALRGRVDPAQLGAPLAALFPGAPPELPRHLSALVAEARAERRPASLIGLRIPLWGANGPFNLHAVPLASADPAMQTLLVVEDLSKLAALESQLVRAEKLSTIGVLAAGIAHEIGTPLGVIRGRAEYLLERAGPEHPSAAGLRVIADQTDRVAATIRQLLDFSRVHAPVARPVSPGAVAAAVQVLLTLEAQRRGVTLALDVPEDVPPVLADEDELRQVLVNLVLNAFDASRPGGRVTVSAAGSQGGVRIRVEDDGSGIPRALQSQVFDPFFSTKKRGQGTGLGLTIVAQIVRNHGGTIELESTEGEGTSVSILWPAAKTPEVSHVAQ